MTTLIWLRAETKALEARSALTPNIVRELCNNGVDVVVERSRQRAIADDDFADTGCSLVDEGSWRGAPEQAFILGLKELPNDITSLTHRHIFFCHAFKQQQGWKERLLKFKQGGGELLDIEYLLDEKKRRVAAFGFWAGFAGCAVGLKTWTGAQLGYDPVINALEPYANKDALLDELRVALASAIKARGIEPKIIIVGAKGRVGDGANQVTQALSVDVTLWDLEETSRGGPFTEILHHDIFINCVLVQQKIPPFVTFESLQANERKLSVIVDVSCDPGEYNPIPIYTDTTSFSQPVTKIIDDVKPLYLCAIDHLPSLLPVESSEDFARQLLPHLLELDDQLTGVWRGALALFHEKSKEL